VLLHHTTEVLDQRWIDPDLGRQMLLGPFQGSLCAIAVRLEGVEPVVENFIKVVSPSSTSR
jgi:hypothetical protein